MKILTILGTRPEIIRLSLIIKKLDQFAERHILVHTGQNYTASLNDIFFSQLKIRKPDYVLNNKQQTLGEQLATMFSGIEKIIEKEKPEKVLILGDTNSGLSAIVAERMGVPVVHMEAGNRCYDLSVPEEKNRRVIDAVSTYNLPYTQKSRENLIREGVPTQRIMVSGNPIFEVLKHYEHEISASDILNKLELKPEDYFLVTTHRAENVDNPIHLKEIFTAINLLADHYQKRVVCSIHPRTKSKIEKEKGLVLHPLVELHEPFGLFDFIYLQKHAFCILTDSGTVQEESCLLHVPAVTIRNSTERPETVECGSSVVSGIDSKQIVEAVKVMILGSKDWKFPEGYEDLQVSTKVVQFLLGGKSNV
ncbi:MAG: UDP-N-acetylglucosamine 2-epimerase (non-hydrolyzing) [Bacillaceae bacterium]|nr:UDP-N-acetylglucosamine 2-epimerase (non-hydrolyzing) [Bacillaceae bacterium]